MENRLDRTRYKTLIAGSICAEGRTDSVVVRNLSSGGAMIECLSPPEEDTPIRFSCPEIGEVDAIVVWVIGPRCGLMFGQTVALRFKGEALAA